MALGDNIKVIRGIIGTVFSIGKGSAKIQWKNASGVMEARNNDDTAYVIGRGLDPVGDDDWVNKRFADSNFPGIPGSSIDLGMTVWDGTGGNTLADSGVRNYGKLATNPVGSGGAGDPAPANGDIYYNTAMSMWFFYDGSRTKWLSFETACLNFGRNGNTNAGVFYRYINGRLFTATIGRYAKWNGTVVAMEYTRSDSDAATFEVTAGGTVITGATLASSAIGGESTTLDGDFIQTNVLGVRNQAGGNQTSNVAGWVTIRWRAT